MLFSLFSAAGLKAQEITTDTLEYTKIKVLSQAQDTLALEDASAKEAAAVEAAPAMALSSVEVGGTPGELSVSPTGGASYTVPIAVPPGIDGVEPDIALTYNSQGGNGLAGWGWNISGISVITRVPATKFHDGGIEAVDFTSTDRFALDGQRLMLKSGTYGKAGAVYETDHHSNVKITSHGTSPYGEAYGPAYFKVTYPDGSVGIYGNGADFRTQTDFAIKYWQNPQGLRVSYTYTKANNGLAVSSIKYGSKTSATPVNEIRFVYKTRKRPEQAYVGGIRFIRKNILSEIKVLGNGTGYRNYVLTHDETSLGYQRLTSIQEKSGDESKSYDPITFSYSTSSGVVTKGLTYDLPLSNIEQRNAEVVSLDFTGNGKMDFLVYPTYGTDSRKKFWLFTDIQSGSTNYAWEVNTGTFTAIMPVTWLTHNDKILPGQGVALIRHEGTRKVKFNVYSHSGTTPVLPQYEKEWDAPVSIRDRDCRGNRIESRVPLNYLSGDFNGDGLTDVMAVSSPYHNIFCSPIPDCGPLRAATGTDSIPEDSLEQATDSGQITPMDIDPCCDCQTSSYNYSTAYFVDLDRRLTTDYVNASGRLEEPYQPGAGDKLLTADVTGDGKTDILHLQEGNIYVYALDNDQRLQLLWQTSDTHITKEFPALLGDYNGDGKTDVLFPTENGSYQYALFLSRGTGFTKIEKTYPFQYNHNYYDGGGTLFGDQLIPIDINGDGKADMVQYLTRTHNDSDEGTQMVLVFHNIYSSSTDASPAFADQQLVRRDGKLRHYPIPVFISSDRPNYNLDFASISDKYVTSFQFRKDNREDVLMRSVTNNSIQQSITYHSLDPAAKDAEGTSVYTAALDETYPYVDIGIAPSTKVVTRLIRYGISPVIEQTFSYYGAVNHAEGLGFLGFKRFTRSNWHTDYDDRIFHITRHDPQLRGAVTQEFTSRNSYINHQVENTDPPPTDVTLSSPSSGDKTVLGSRSVTLKPGFSAKGTDGTFIARTAQASGVDDEATLSDYITRTDYQYQTQTKSNKVFINVPTEISTKDLLNGTNTAKYFAYDGYYNPTEETTSYSGAGTEEVKITYANSTGSTYYIGRPVKKTTTTRAGGDTYTTEEQYTYTGYLLSTIKSKGHNTAFITETRQHDTFGNIIRKTLTPSGEPARITSYEYDPSGRFLTKQTNAEFLSTTWQYNMSTGNVTRETDPYGLSTNFSYDAWGKQTMVTDHLGNSMTTTYQKSGNQSIITETGDDGSGSESTYDALGRLVQVREKNVMNQWIGRSVEYDHLDRKVRESEPYTGSASQWNETEYDIYGRVKQITSYTGKTTNITYNKLTTTVNDGTKTVTTTKDAMDRTVKVTDPGGTVNYTYFASGNLKSSSYDGTTISIEQDGWGRKTKLTDPSAGTYTYAYNGFGDITKETTPKGTTTYTYYDTGKLLSKKVQGDHTDMLITYSYNASTKLLSSVSLTNADGNEGTQSFTYDSYQRIKTAVENNTHARFTQTYTYDSFGRVLTEEFEAMSLGTGKTATKKIKHAYQNGALKSIADNTSGESIWEVSGVNARGQVTRAALGSAIQQTNTYDPYGFPTERKTEKISGSATTEIMTLTYSFNAERGTLNSRTSSLFNWNETFSYDNLDRLTTFNDNSGNKSQTYDSKGRITDNSAIGTYTYNGSSYRQNELNVIAAVRPHYEDRPSQQVSYNAFKSPVEITEAGHEKISFQYNASLGRAHMYYGGEQSDKMQRPFRKHYSEDGSMEITYNKGNGTTTFVIYLGGDAYSAPAIWREEHSSSGTQKALYYLHRDYLGSILAITGKTGNIKEKRHFDAWGNIVKLQDGSGNTLSSLTILDRGYTGHEHLHGVRLIHMNGRLYDPMLHRFLAPDNHVQDPFNTQNFNRYGYAMNNPLMYTDPDGEFLIPALIGMAIGIITNGINNVIHDRPFFKGAVKAGFFGAVGGAASWGIGQLAAGITNSIAASVFQAGAHSVLGGTMSVAQGGEFWSGALAGGFSSAVASGVGALGIQSNTWKAITGIGGGSISGGIGSVIAGGNFWDGLRQGALSAGLNHGVHSGWFGKGLAMAAISGRTRHLFRPDAKAIAGTFDVSSGVNIGFEKGKLVILTGPDEGIYNINDVGTGVGWLSVAAGMEIVELYSSAHTVRKDHFYGPRTEANLSITVFDISFGRTALLSKHDQGFTIGIGGTLALDAIPFNIGFNINYGAAVESFWELPNAIKKAFGF